MDIHPSVLENSLLEIVVATQPSRCARWILWLRAQWFDLENSEVFALTEDSLVAFLWKHRVRIRRATCPGASYEEERSMMLAAVEEQSIEGIWYLSKYFDICHKQLSCDYIRKAIDTQNLEVLEFLLQRLGMRCRRRKIIRRIKSKEQCEIIDRYHNWTVNCKC